MSWRVSVLVAFLWTVGFVSAAFAGNRNNNGFGNQVGGVSISAEGAISTTDPLQLKQVNELLQEQLQGPSGKLKKPVELRKISLRAIEEALAMNGGAPVTNLPEEIRFLAGIQRLQYVLLYPESNDIVLAGPGEGWKLDGKGNMVGVTTGRPVLNLDDFIVAFRTIEAARQGQLSCSIDPTAEGRQRFEQLMSAQKTFSPAIVGAVEKAFGDQQVTVSGAPETSHFACVLVAADYKMKRIGMKLEASPVKGLSSYIDMAPARVDNMMPRWWMACNYEPLGKSEDGLSWEIRGQGVKVETEDEFVNNAAGTVRGSGKTSPAAQKWSEQFTSKYDELAVQEPIFGELRNVMDMCVIAALFAKEDFAAKAKCELPQLTSSQSKIALDKWLAPKKVATQSSATKKGANWVITASGGVSINSWEAADKTVVQPAVGEVRGKAKQVAGASENLWWN
ncbi:DUF1598 domain-containing protein [Anatilimnocola floriformis]|uniref:DUF1598 domain-containing protein n=1 Tax=Anatilimnocola floriformis TaxID=2948575 RepID=UPI0020C23AB6|nr:DUF1598 domain-containing protein [Anatilimnocola floriformis]